VQVDLVESDLVETCSKHVDRIRFVAHQHVVIVLGTLVVLEQLVLLYQSWGMNTEVQGFDRH